MNNSVEWLDLSYIGDLTSSEGNEDFTFFSKLVITFKTQLSPIMLECMNSDLSKIGFYLHKIKGASLNMGAKKLAVTAENVLMSLSTYHDHSHLKLNLESLSKIYEQTILKLEKIVETSKLSL